MEPRLCMLVGSRTFLGLLRVYSLALTNCYSGTQTRFVHLARDNHLDVVHVLLHHGALVRVTDKNGWTALDYGSAFDELRLLLESAISREISRENTAVSAVEFFL
jgi:ankyrin repeat protein